MERQIQERYVLCGGEQDVEMRVANIGRLEMTNVVTPSGRALHSHHAMRIEASEAVVASARQSGCLRHRILAYRPGLADLRLIAIASDNELDIVVLDPSMAEARALLDEGREQKCLTIVLAAGNGDRVLYVADAPADIGFLHASPGTTGNTTSDQVMMALYDVACSFTCDEIYVDLELERAQLRAVRVHLAIPESRRADLRQSFMQRSATTQDKNIH